VGAPQPDDADPRDWTLAGRYTRPQW